MPKHYASATSEKRLLCHRHPIFYQASVWHKRARRYLSWWVPGQRYSLSHDNALPVCVHAHQSVLMRKLGSTDVQLQLNKVRNLQLAQQRLDGIVILPGETFSFWRLVGMPTRRKGYLKGMLLSRGEARAGIGGGLCQMSNLLHWMLLHTPMTIIERHHHGFDPFPDDGRVLPFGSGATIFYNYLDLQARNDTSFTFQIKVWLTDEHLKGEIRCNQGLLHSYHVLERNHAFIVRADKYYRQNEIWRRVVDRRTGDSIREELITENLAEVKYRPGAITHEAQ